MRIIENSIPKEWNQFQRAKYIYEVLGKKIDYNHNIEDYKTQRPSNLTCILTRKAICAGYSLLYKEMMDRQQIECDYVRGIGYSYDRTQREKHAWNVLTINGQTFPVDLTWESAKLRKGEEQLQYFGVDDRFFETHEIDPDERKDQYVRFSKESINSINTNPQDRRIQVDKEQKTSVVQHAIEQTYLKFEKVYGEEGAREQVEKAIRRYIETEDSNGFTRQGEARTQIKQFVSKEDMLELMTKSFVEYNYNGNNQNVLGRVLENSVNETAKAYGIEQAQKALKKYITQGIDTSFTRTNNARSNLRNYELLPEKVIELMIGTVTTRNIEEIEQNKTIVLDNGMYFNAEEFAKMDLPKEKKIGILSKTIQWIKERTKEKLTRKRKQNKNIENMINYNEER